MILTRAGSLLWLLPALGAAGWFGGRWAHEGLLPDSSARPSRAVSSPVAAARAPDVTASSPEGKWMARARVAASADFPALFEDFGRISKTLNPRARQAARKWLLGLWIARDAGAAAAYVAETKDQGLGAWFGLLLAGMAPEKAAAIINGPHGQAMSKEFTAAATRTLAMTDPREYLRAIEKPGKSASLHWPEALGALAMENPREAAALWTERNAANGAQKALSAVLSSWVQRDPQAARAWADSMEDPKLRHLAQHAWLTGLAQHDLQAARRALTDFEAGEWVPGKPATGSTSEFLISDARMEIAVLTARTDLATALKDLAVTATIQATDDRRETQSAIVAAALPSLPKEPAALLAALQKLKSDAGPAMDQKLFASVEAELLAGKLRGCALDTALEAVRLLAARPADGSGPGLINELICVSAHRDAERTVGLLAVLPEAQRGALAAVAFESFYQADAALLARAAALVPASEWTSQMGGRLAQAPAENAALVAGLPVNSRTGMTRAEFGESWARSDPDAATRWVTSLPQNDGSAQAARGVTTAWAGYDDIAASAWAASLPPGQIRDGAALGLVVAVAGSDPEAAWKWAASITGSQLAVVAYANVARQWGGSAPPEFATALSATLDAAGVPQEDRKRVMTEALTNKTPDKDVFTR